MKKLIALTIMFVLAFTLTACGAVSGRITDTFVNIFSSGSYHMKAKMITDGVEATMESYVKRDIMAVIMETHGVTMRTVMRDNKVHIIDNAEKTVMTMPASMGAPGSTPAVDTNKMNYLGSGTANFHGKNLPYDEYSVDNGGKTQLFVDGNKLAGIRNISGGNVADIVILVLDQNVPDSVFEIPAGYTQISF